VRSEAAAGDFLIGVEDLFAKRFEEHGGFPWPALAVTNSIEYRLAAEGAIGGVQIVVTRMLYPWMQGGR
jgi:hypothetical protein